MVIRPGWVGPGIRRPTPTGRGFRDCMDDAAARPGATRTRCTGRRPAAPMAERSLDRRSPATLDTPEAMRPHADERESADGVERFSLPLSEQKPAPFWMKISSIYSRNDQRFQKQQSEALDIVRPCLLRRSLMSSGRCAPGIPAEISAYTCIQSVCVSGRSTVCLRSLLAVT